MYVCSFDAVQICMLCICGHTLTVNSLFFLRRHLILSLAKCALMGPFITLCIHMSVIHAPYNIWAEITRFADRGFYEVRS